MGRRCRSIRGGWRPAALRTGDGVQGEQALAEAYEQYEAALASGDHARVVLARVSLIAQLQATGWEPPPEVLDQMWRDRRALREIEHERVVEVADVLRLPSHRPPDPRHRRRPAS